MRRIGGSIAVVVLVPLLLGACSHQEAGRPSSGGEVGVGQMAPDFTLPSAKSGKVTLSDLKGKPVLLYFSMGPG